MNKGTQCYIKILNPCIILYYYIALLFCAVHLLFFNFRVYIFCLIDYWNEHFPITRNTSASILYLRNGHPTEQQTVGSDLTVVRCGVGQFRVQRSCVQFHQFILGDIRVPVEKTGRTEYQGSVVKSM